jgi:hypothetical protein
MEGTMEQTENVTWKTVPRGPGFGTQKKMTATDVKLYKVPSGTGMSPFGLYGDGRADDEDTVVTPEVESVFVAADRVDDYVLGDSDVDYRAEAWHYRILAEAWHRTPAEAWAAWRKVIEQELVYLRQYLANGIAEAEGAAA